MKKWLLMVFLAVGVVALLWIASLLDGGLAVVAYLATSVALTAVYAALAEFGDKDV